MALQIKKPGPQAHIKFTGQGGQSARSKLSRSYFQACL